jgi:ferric-dicitrate binding protein FerR (iron transport regulator)
MTSLSCLHAGRLLDARASGLSDADKLRLEEHLEACERCSADAAVLRGIVALVDPPPLRPSARERAIARALAAPRRTLAARRRVAWAALPVAAALTTAVAVLVAIAVVWMGRPSEPPPIAGGAPARDASDDGGANATTARVISGGARIGDRAVEPGATWPEGSVLRADSATSVAVGHAVVDLAPGGVAAWDAASATLTLEHGSAHVEVDPRPRLPFRVATATHHVDVLGTVFDVDGDGVRVAEGRVRVVDHATRGVVAELGPGESWSRAPKTMDRATEPAPSASSSAASGSAASVRTAAPSERPSDLLARARAQLAADRPADAEVLVQRALALPLVASERAEAQTLLAECARARGDEAEAARRYGEVASSFGDLPAGETALFAAARSEERAGRRTAAVALFRKYLTAYPDGRFRREASAHLRALETEEGNPR